MASCVEIKLHLVGAIPYFQLVNFFVNGKKTMENSSSCAFHSRCSLGLLRLFLRGRSSLASPAVALR